MWFLKKQKSVMRQASSKDKRPTINSPSKSQSDMLEQYMMIEKEIRPIESYMANCAVSLNAKLLLNERIETLQKLIDAFYSLKSKCYSLGPEYQTYFSEMWEHAHNSKDADFCYVDRFECELKELLKNKDQLSAKESLYISQTNNLKSKIESVLSESHSIIQTDLYKRFDPVVQNDISTILYFMAKDGTITRTKHGRTYLIEYKG
ncbi:MAG: hypothetical protein ACLTTD_17310 [Oscillospiraceae bacterium]|jgi:hypothetical protein